MKILKAFLLYLILLMMIGLLRQTAAGLFGPGASIMSIWTVIFGLAKISKWNREQFLFKKLAFAPAKHR